MDKGLDEIWHFLSLGLHVCKVGMKGPHLTGLQREQNVWQVQPWVAPCGRSEWGATVMTPGLVLKNRPLL